MIEYDLPLKCANWQCERGVITLDPRDQMRLQRLTIPCDCEGRFEIKLKLEKPKND